MSGPELRVVFLGSDEFSVPILERLIADGPGLSNPVAVKAVVTQPDRPSGRGRTLIEGPVKAVAGRAGIQVLQPVRVGASESVARLVQLSPDLFVVASFGQLLPTRVLAIPSAGSLNLHPSLLPRYRGPSPIAGPILAGDSVTGTTVMEMVLAMDAGPVVAQERTAIGPEETAGELRLRLAQMSADLLVRTIPSWAAGESAGTAQNDAEATYTRLISKMDGLVDWSRPAEETARAVRAYDPWPAAFTYWGDTRVSLYRAQAMPGTGEQGMVVAIGVDGLLVGTGTGLLLVRELQLAGGRRLPATAVANGRPGLATARFGDRT